MKKQETVKTCRKCGKLIGIIECGIYRKIVVDAEAVLVMTDGAANEKFVDVTGRKIVGREADFEEQASYGVPGGPEYAYRPHKCGGSR